MADSGDHVTKIELLNGKNFQTWKYNVKLVLMQKGLWGFVDGTEKVPTKEDTAAIKALYKSKSEKAYSHIALTVDKHVQIHIVGTVSPKDAWDILENQFNFVSVSQIVRITRKFYAATMKEGDDLQSHLTVMSALAQQLRELGEEVSSQKFATAVLGSLPSSFDAFISSLNARKKEEYDWDSIKGALLEEDIKHAEKSKSKNTEDEAFFAKGRGDSSNRFNRGSRPFRSTYNRRGNANGRGNGVIICYRCNNPGHLARDCRENSACTSFDQNAYYQVYSPNQYATVTGVTDSFQNMSVRPGQNVPFYRIN